MKQELTAIDGNLENLTVNQQRAIALQQYEGNKFFILNEDHDTVRIFEGELSEAKKDFSISDATDLLTWCVDNLTEIEEYDTEDYNNDYLVLTDSEADEKAKEYILDSVWAFNASFLAEETDIDIEVFEAIQANDKCEGNNDAILSCIDDEDRFVESAIRADGRGHFLSMYDGKENKEDVFGNTYYIYRVN
jgi:hypothetical protein